MRSTWLNLSVDMPSSTGSSAHIPPLPWLTFALTFSAQEEPFAI